MTTLHLMTRGTARRMDYRFVGPAPEYWWEPVSSCTDLDGAELVVRSDPRRLRVMVCGVPSCRRDAVGTAIRFTLAVDDPDDGVLRRLVGIGLSPDVRARLGAALDAELPADWVDATYAGTAPADGVDDRVGRALDVVVDGAEEADESEGAAHPLRWAGSRDDPHARDAFLARIEEFVSGERTGWAFTTAALTSARGVSRATVGLQGALAVLLTGPDPATIADLAPSAARARASAGSGKGRAGRRAGPPSRRPGAPTVVATVLLLTGSLALVLLLLL